MYRSAIGRKCMMSLHTSTNDRDNSGSVGLAKGSERKSKKESRIWTILNAISVDPDAEIKGSYGEPPTEFKRDFSSRADAGR